MRRDYLARMVDRLSPEDSSCKRSDAYYTCGFRLTFKSVWSVGPDLGALFVQLLSGEKITTMIGHDYL